MKLKSLLYTITKIEPTASGADYQIRLNSDCVIYKAHFPEQPVTPGVCIIEMSHELLEEHLQCPLAVKLVKNVKFLNIISPLEVQDLTYQLTNVKLEEGGAVKAQITVTGGETVYTKISLVCQQ